MLAPAAPAAQLPPAVQEVFRDFSRDGIVSPCRHTVDDLRETRANIPPDIDQYAPDFPEAVRAALEAHARGACAGDAAAGGEVGGGAAPGPAAGAPGSPAGAEGSPAVAAAPPGTPTKTVASEPPAPDAGEETTAGAQQVAVTELTRVAARTASSDAPAPVWIVGAGAALLALVALATLLAGRTRRGAEGLDNLRHSWGEAAWRASASWTDFREWVRTGR